MIKHRGLFLSLGLIALLGLSAREARAEAMSLTVYLNGNLVYETAGPTGGPNAHQAVTANTTILNGNAALTASGYSFSSLSGSSNNPGTSGSVGGYISDSGNLTYDPSVGTGGILTIVVNEDGFTAPSSGTGNKLTGASTANYSPASAGSATPLTPTYQQFVGMFSDSSVPPVTATTPTITQVANGTASDDHSDSSSVGLGAYVTSYTLTSTTTIDLTASTGSVANDVFTGKVSVLAVPEPASLVMMVTGMPLPLVVMGLLRRRRAPAAA